MKAQVRKRVIPLAGAALLLVVMALFALWRAHEYARPTRPYPLLLPVKVNGEWGYIDRTGKIVIQPRFKQVGEFGEGYATVVLKPGLLRLEKQAKAKINTRGRIVRKLDYDFALYYSEGLSAANFGGLPDPYAGWPVGGKWGFVDRVGSIVIPPTFERAYSFSEGLAPVRIDGKWGYIDKDGDIAIAPRFEGASSFGFSEGLAAVEVQGKSGYIDKSGEIVIGPRFDRTLPFAEGVAFVNIGFNFRGAKETHSTGKWGLIDKQGNWLVEPELDCAHTFAEGLSGVCVEGKWGFVDTTGQFAIEPRFDDAYWFSDGLAAVKVGMKTAADGKAVEDWGKWGFTDKTGRFVIDPKFDEARWFFEGFRGARVGRTTGEDGEVVSWGKWGVINKSGKWMVKAKYDDVKVLKDAIVSVEDNERVGYIDTETGEFIWEPTE